MKKQELARALEANLEAELAGKTAQCTLLEKQEAAIRAADARTLDEATRELFVELNRGVERANGRARLMRELASALGVAGRRVGDLADALGADGSRLASQRSELRKACADSLARGRRMSVLVRAHGALIEEALGRFLAPDPSGAPLGRGSLVDARA
jgi:hypothetical protein